MGATLFGTLGAQQTARDHAAQEAAAGFRAAAFEVNWLNAESASRGYASEDYIATMRLAQAELAAADRLLTLEAGAFHSPPWLADTAGIHHVDQRGRILPQINYVWNAEAREYWQNYVDQLDGSYGIDTFTAVRIGSASDVELLYPAAGYSGYDTGAQSGYGLAGGQRRCPYPGWTAGGADAALSAAEIDQWLAWYVDSLVNTAIWQMDYLRSKGFAGWFEVICPGQGARPRQVADAVDKALPVTGSVPAGAIWQQVVPRLPHDRVRVHISSVGDRSGIPPNNLPRAADASISLDDLKVEAWSATRWLVHLARTHGFDVSMENVGYTQANSAYYADLGRDGLLACVAATLDEVHPSVFYWAHSNRLWDATIPFNAVAAMVQQRS